MLRRKKDRPRERFKHSTMGKNSCYLAIVAYGLFIVAVAIAYVMRGKTLGIVGGMGILAMICAGYGIQAGIKGLRERDRNYITCRIGIAVNGIGLLGAFIIFFGGLC